MPARAKKGKKPLPRWMLDQIKVEHPEGFDHHAHWQQCPKCGAWTLAGADWTHDWCYVAFTDLTPLNTGTELQALVMGRRTFEVLIKWEKVTLRSRDPWRIGAHTPEKVGSLVVPAHRCHDPIGEPLSPKKFLRKATP